MAIACPEGAPFPWWSDWSPQAYAIVVGAGLSGMGQVHCLNMGLRSGDAVVVVPVFLSLGMLAQMLTGGVFFDELHHIGSATQAVAFILGVVMLIVCVAILTIKNAGAENSER